MTEALQPEMLVRPQLNVLVVEDDDDDFLIASELLTTGSRSGVSDSG